MSAIYRACAILMVLLVVMLTGAWAEGLQSWGEAWTIAGICTVVAYGTVFSTCGALPQHPCDRRVSRG